MSSNVVIGGTNLDPNNEKFLVKKTSKQNRVFIIQCKKCHNRMKYMTHAPVSQLSTKVKRCVYCGFSNNVAKAIIIPGV